MTPATPSSKKTTANPSIYHLAIINLYEFIFHEWFRLKPSGQTRSSGLSSKSSATPTPKKATKPRKAKKPKATVPALKAAFSVVHGFDILDLVLEKASGKALIKHLYSMVLYGKLTKGGPPTKKPKSKEVLQDGAVKDEWKLSDSNTATVDESDQDTNNHDFIQDVGEDEDEDEDIGRKLHSPFCVWIHPLLVVCDHQTPSAAQPVLCLQKKFKSCFVAFEERPLSPILWGNNKSCPNPARDSALKITTEQEAHRLVEQNYGDLIKILFYKCRDLIRAPPSIWQTNYGKKTTTIASLANANPSIHRTFSLQAHLTKKFQFIAYANQRREQDHASDQALHLNRPTL
ncbi:hypothetical protein BGX24_002247 [Mortierella sp. AD032]|nr:hypothetical protein BGX24_002247 [Mortierella sp. AD032]